MADVVEVDDPADPRLVEVAGLTDAQRRRGTEAEHGCFVVEGLRTLETAVHSSHELRMVLCSGSKLDRVLATVGHLDIDVHVGSLDLLRAVVGFPIHRGVVASAARRPLPRAGELLEGMRRAVIVEGLNDHENLGALFRNAAAFGVDAVLVDPTTADPLYRRSVRVSLGHVLDVPWTRIGPLPGALAGIHDRGFETVALSPTGDATMAAVAGAEKLAWLVGAEGPGLTAGTLGAATHRVAIPMAPGVDSLNAATAAAVAFALDASGRG